MIKLPSCCDTLININNNLIAGCYLYQDDYSTGYILNVTKNICIENKGTLKLKKKSESILSCEANRLAIYDIDLNLIAERVHDCILFDVVWDDKIYCCDKKGRIVIFGEAIEIVAICTDILWCIYKEGDIIYTGGDDGIIYSYNIKNKNIGQKKFQGVITFINHKFVCNYAGVYNISDFSLFFDKGCWEIKEYGNLLILSCLTEGLYLYDVEFKKIGAGVVYTAEEYGGKIYYSDYLERLLKIVDLNK